MNEIQNTEDHGKHECPKDDLVVNRVPVYGTVASGRTAASAPSGERVSYRTYYEIENIILKATRGITP